MSEATERLVRLIEREGTGISWADMTFNPWIGCTKISPACDHCYAETLSTTRLGVPWGAGADRRKTGVGNWQKPFRWHKIASAARARLFVFCASLADVFDNEADPEWRKALARVVTNTPSLDWMILTKRIGNVRQMMQEMWPDGIPANVCLGVTIASQTEADRDLPKAISTKAGLGIKRLFVSAEPLLGPLDLQRYLEWIDLVIVGGESGKFARSMPDEWPIEIKQQCAASRTPFHFKQFSQADRGHAHATYDLFPRWATERGHFL